MGLRGKYAPSSHKPANEGQYTPPLHCDGDIHRLFNRRGVTYGVYVCPAS